MDYGIILPALALVIASFFFAYKGSPARSGIAVKAEQGEWVFPPDAKETIRVQGPLGETIIEIQNNKGRIISSPCANQTCVSSGEVHSQGQWAACLPNKVMLYIAGEKKASVLNKDAADVDASSW